MPESEHKGHISPKVGPINQSPFMLLFQNAYSDPTKQIPRKGVVRTKLTHLTSSFLSPDRDGGQVEKIGPIFVLRET